MTAVVEERNVAPALQAAQTAGLISSLEDRDVKLRVYALEQLAQISDFAWPEIADSLSVLEAMYEDDSFPHRNLAALVIAQTYYHLEEYTEALQFVLGAGSQFKLAEATEFVKTMTSKLVDEYVRLKTEGEMVDVRLEEVMQSVFEKCLVRGECRMGLGIALESGRLDWVKRYIIESGDLSGMLNFLLKNLGGFIADKKRRGEVLKLLLEVYTHTPADKRRDWSGLAQCFFLLGDSASIADLLRQLLQFEEDPHWGWLMAYQVAFDLADNEDQRLNAEISSSPSLAELEEPSDVIANIKSILSGQVQTRLTMEFLYRNNKTDMLILDSMKSAEMRSAVVHNGVVIAHGLMQTGTASDAFLRNNLEWLAKAVQWAKFTATASLGAVHKGHVKESKNILSTYLPPDDASSTQQRRSPFSEGGALFALGLVHANQSDTEARQYLLGQLEKNKEQEVLQVGACLGLGMTCLATRDSTVYEQLKATLFCDNAVAGEAAALGIGCVMAGSGDLNVTDELLRYAKDTQHEKISRACCVGAALTAFRQEQAFDGVIARMTTDSDAVVRYGGMYALALAYCGTAQNDAIRKLLHFSVSDASDDVRRAAVIGLAFVLANEAHQLPKVLKLLAESYNPHVRYAVAIAIGIACAGRAASMPEALELIEPLSKDLVDFVRQGAWMGIGMLCQEVSDKQLDGKVGKLRETMLKVVAPTAQVTSQSKPVNGAATPAPAATSGSAAPAPTRVTYEDSMVRFGAAVGLGFMDMAGRNAVLSFFSRSGRLRLSSAVGLCLFSQVWFSFPLTLTASLAIAPTACIALNERLKMPRQFAARTKASVANLYAYPEAMKTIEKQDQQKVQAAVLSVGKKLKSSPSFVMSTSSITAQAGTQPSTSVTSSAPMSIEEAPIQQPTKENLILFNPFRVVPGQERSIDFFKVGETQPIKGGKEKVPVRYSPILGNGRRSGWLVLSDNQPTQPEDLLDFEEQQAPVVAPPAEQPKPAAAEPVVVPEEFEWNE